MYKVNSVDEWKKSTPLLALIVLCIYIIIPGDILSNHYMFVCVTSFVLWVSLCSQTNNYNGNPCIVNSLFFQVLLGFEHRTPKGVAHYWVLLIGLTLEWLILHATFIEFSGSNESIYNKALVFVSVAIISSLLIHQILIFRNFTVAGSPTFDAPVLWICTFLIFIGIGAIAGEIGYLFAVSKLSHIGDNGGLITWIMETMGTNHEYLLKHKMIAESSDIEIETLKRSLKGIFIVGAFIVCLFVIIWDLLLYKKRKIFGDNLWYWFIGMDALSLIIWGIVSTMVIPRITTSLGNKEFTIMLFLITTLVYVASTCFRVRLGYLKLKNTNEMTSNIGI